MTKMFLVTLSLLSSSLGWAAFTNSKASSDSSFGALAGPYDLVAPLLGDDPVTADRMAGQLYFNLSSGSFNAIDSTGTVVTLGSVTTAQVPQITTYTSGTGSYDVPAGTRYLRVRMVGGGGGGGACGTASPGDGGPGGDTIFGSYIAGNGVGGGASTASAVGARGTGGVLEAGSPTISFSGQDGSQGPIVVNTAPSTSEFGGAGGSSLFGGGGTTSFNSTGGSAKQNTGSGGAGGGGSTAFYPGSGGGAGAYVEHIISNPDPDTDISYTVGGGGNAGTVSGGNAGGAGAIGLIIVEAYFQ